MFVPMYYSPLVLQTISGGATISESSHTQFSDFSNNTTSSSKLFESPSSASTPSVSLLHCHVNNIARGRGRGRDHAINLEHDKVVSELVMADDQRLQRHENQVENLSSGGLVVPKLAKLDFPCYDGSEDPTLWICRAEQVFEFQGTSLEDQVKLATYHLEKDAQLWYQQWKNQGHLVTWME
ncbi:hypothetical protein CK203_016154 [Vitis vinifera]|uniref:Retrotransposon gag domain-containing protein n=1 Tax=Vitis vinifera TaxID=29760 RepID=A0A438JMM7_VITVI|nr:hypothetical protein CK203_016154 [Vitis vinifera]